MNWNAFTEQERLSSGVSKTKSKEILTVGQQQLALARLLDESRHPEHRLDSTRMHSNLAGSDNCKSFLFDEVRGDCHEMGLQTVGKQSYIEVSRVGRKRPRDLRRYWGGR